MGDIVRKETETLMVEQDVGKKDSHKHDEEVKKTQEARRMADEKAKQEAEEEARRAFEEKVNKEMEDELKAGREHKEEAGKTIGAKAKQEAEDREIKDVEEKARHKEVEGLDARVQKEMEEHSLPVLRGSKVLTWLVPGLDDHGKSLHARLGVVLDIRKDQVGIFYVVKVDGAGERNLERGHLFCLDPWIAGRSADEQDRILSDMVRDVSKASKKKAEESCLHLRKGSTVEVKKVKTDSGLDLHGLSGIVVDTHLIPGLFVVNVEGAGMFDIHRSNLSCIDDSPMIPAATDVELGHTAKKIAKKEEREKANKEAKEKSKQDAEMAKKAADSMAKEWEKEEKKAKTVADEAKRADKEA